MKKQSKSDIIRKFLTTGWKSYNDILVFLSLAYHSPQSGDRILRQIRQQLNSKGGIIEIKDKLYMLKEKKEGNFKLFTLEEMELKNEF